MKHKISALLFSALIMMNFTSCEKSDKPEIQLEEVNNTNVDEPENIADRKLLETKIPNQALFEGEWVFTEGETDSMKYTAEEMGYKSEISVTENTARYFFSTDFETQRFDADLVFLEEPLYPGCHNDAWSVQFLMKNSDFEADEEFYATLTDENTLLLQHYFPFDGTQGVSYQKYIRK